MGIDKTRFLKTFKAEAETYLGTLEKGIVRLEKEKDSVALIEELFRAAHTLKGDARMMGFKEISDSAHRIEDLFYYRGSHL